MEEDGDMQLTEEGVMNACTTNLIDEPPMISLNALSRENTYRTMRVKGFEAKLMAMVIHPFDAQADSELRLDVDVYVIVDHINMDRAGNRSRDAVGEDLVAMTKCHFQARPLVTQDGISGVRKMKCFTSVMPLNFVSPAGSVNDSFKKLSVDTSELDSIASFAIKRPRFESNHALVEVINEINRGLIDTVVNISKEDADPTAASDGGDGTVCKCSFSAVALGPYLKSQYASAQMSPIQPLRLLIPENYPNFSLILLDNKEYEDLSTNTKSRFSISLRSISQPMSLKEIAKTRDVCACAVISDHAQQSGGGTFSSKYGTCKNCLSAA
ncbi:hypothetical protein Tco_0156289 [Tanacetum coccineum]